MSSVAKTVVATGLSSGLGIEALKQLLQQTQPYRIIFGARNTEAATSALQALEFDRAANPVTILPLDLADIKGVKSFAQTTLDKLGQTKIDYLFLNAGITNPATQPSSTGSQWCDSLVVNHISHHYLVHLLREKLEASKSRIVVVSSGAIRGVTDPKTLDADLKAGSTADGQTTYSASKFAQLLGAHWWRRELSGVCDVVAVSPGLIPGTGLGRGSGFTMPPDMPDAKPLDEGASNLIRAFTKSDFPDDPDRIFLTSWGDWWETSVIEKSLDKKLQDKWSFSQDTIEKEAGIQ